MFKTCGFDSHFQHHGAKRSVGILSLVSERDTECLLQLLATDSASSKVAKNMHILILSNDGVMVAKKAQWDLLVYRVGKHAANKYLGVAQR